MSRCDGILLVAEDHEQLASLRQLLCAEIVAVLDRWLERDWRSAGGASLLDIDFALCYPGQARYRGRARRNAVDAQTGFGTVTVGPFVVKKKGKRSCLQCAWLALL